MPPSRSAHRHPRTFPIDDYEDYKNRVQAAKQDYLSGKCQSVQEAANLHNVSQLHRSDHLADALCQVNRRTVNDRILGKKSRLAVLSDWQLLTPTQEGVLIDWIDHYATTAKPFNALDLHSIAFDMTGEMPGKDWHRRFAQRHPELRRSKPSHLDPKRAQNFNQANITHFFNLTQQLMTQFPNLPPEHIWNMDEKGIQLGGGRKNTPQKYFHLGYGADRIKSVSVVICTRTDPGTDHRSGNT